MKKAISFFLVLVVAWVGISAIDCGCAFAGTDTHSQSKVGDKKTSSCHQVEEKAQEEPEGCCLGHELQEQAPIPPPK